MLFQIASNMHGHPCTILFGFQMHPQIACLNICKFAITAFVFTFTAMCFKIAPIFPALHVTTVTLDSFDQVTWNITWRGSRQKRKYSVCLFPVQLERGNVELSCGSLFQFKLILKLYFHKISSSSCSYGLSPDIDLCWDFKWCQMKHTTQRRKVVQLDRICFDIDCLKIDVQ